MKRTPKSGFFQITNSELFSPYDDDIIRSYLNNEQSQFKLKSIFGFFKAQFYFLDEGTQRTVELKLNAPLMSDELKIFCDRLDIACGEFFETFIIKQSPIDNDEISADRWLSFRTADPGNVNNKVLRRIGTIKKFKSSHFGKTLIKTANSIKVDNSGETTKDFKTQMTDKVKTVFTRLYGKNKFSLDNFKIIKTQVNRLSSKEFDELKTEYAGFNVSETELVLICETNDERIVDKMNDDINFHQEFFDKKYAKNQYQKLVAIDSSQI